MGVWDNYNIEEVATPVGFVRNPVVLHDFYNTRRSRLKKAKPNAAHLALARLEGANGSNVLTVTQNIDGLREAAARTTSFTCTASWGECSARAAARACRGYKTCRSPPPARCATKRALCVRTSCGSARCCGRWSASTTRSTLRSLPLYRHERYGLSGPGFVAEAASEGAHTVELNLDPSECASLFAEAHYGPATEIVPALVETLLSA